METDRVGSSAVGPPDESPVRRSTSAHDHHDDGPLTVLPPFSVYAGTGAASTVGFVVGGPGFSTAPGVTTPERHVRASAGQGDHDRGREDHEQDDAGDDRQNPRTRQGEHRVGPVIHRVNFRSPRVG